MFSVRFRGACQADLISVFRTTDPVSRLPETCRWTRQRNGARPAAEAETPPPKSYLQMVTATALGAFALVGVLAGTSATQGLRPPVELRTYYSPLDYLAPAYAVPVAGAAYLFYPEDVVQFEVLLLNRGSVPAAILMSADPSAHISLSIRLALGDANPLPRQAWTVASDQIRIRRSDASEVLAAAGSSVVLHPGAALIFPIAFNDSASWPGGLVTVVADVSVACDPACAVVPFSNLLRFEARTTLNRIDRMEQGYRRALRAFLAKDGRRPNVVWRHSRRRTGTPRADCPYALVLPSNAVTESPR